MQYITRAQAGLVPPDYRNVGNLSDESTEHWNGPELLIGGQNTWNHSKCASIVRGIQSFHMKTRGWSDIAYNFLVCPHGYVFEGRGLNVINGANGTTYGNRTSHAICSLAGQGNPFPLSEKIGIRNTVRYIADNTNAPDRCQGHRDHKATQCPGDERYTWVHNGMPLNSEEDDEMLSPEDLTAIGVVVRDQLNAGTGSGQASWAGTNKAILSTVQGNSNKLNSLLKASVSPQELAEALRPVLEELLQDSPAGATADEIVDKLVLRLQD